MFRIGEFSKFSRVSVKMLRHYDEIGLLKPARVDPHSDYRYYSADQLTQLNRILVFKDLGFSLEQIAQLLHEDLSTDQVLGMLRLKQAQVEQELQAQQTRLAALATRLKQIESEGRLPSYEVMLKQTDPQLMASLRLVIPTDQDIGPYFFELERYVQPHHARAAAAPVAIYQCEGGEMEVELLVPIKAKIPQSRRIKVRELEATPLMASVVHTGAYCTINQACQSLIQWIQEQGYRDIGAWREVYLRFGAEPSLNLSPAFLADREDDFVTELQLPVELA